MTPTRTHTPGVMSRNKTATLTKVASQNTLAQSPVALPASAPLSADGNTFGMLMELPAGPADATLPGMGTLPMNTDMQASALSRVDWETCAQLPSSAPADSLQLELETVIEESLGAESTPPLPAPVLQPGLAPAGAAKPPQLRTPAAAIPAQAATLVDVQGLSAAARVGLKGGSSEEAAGMDAAIAASMMEASAHSADAILRDNQEQADIAAALRASTSAVAAGPAFPTADQGVPPEETASTDVLSASDAESAAAALAARKNHRAQYMALDRACKNPARTPPALMEEWAKGNQLTRTSLLRSWVTSGGNIQEVSMDLIRLRQRSSTLTDVHEYLNRASILARLTCGHEPEADEIIRQCVARGGRFVRPDPNCPTISSMQQFWVVISTSGTISDMVSEHEKMFVTVTMAAAEAATMLGHADNLGTSFGQDSFGIAAPSGVVPKAKGKAKAKAAADSSGAPALQVESVLNGEDATNTWTAMVFQTRLLLLPLMLRFHLHCDSRPSASHCK